jgi:hypothetical protein
MDTAKAGTLIAEQMEALERDYGDKDDHEIGAIITIVEIQGPDGAHFRIRNNLPNPALTLGVLRMAEHEWIAAMKTPGAFGPGPGDSDG